MPFNGPFFVHLLGRKHTRDSEPEDNKSRHILRQVSIRYKRLGRKRSGGQIKGLTTRFWLFETILFPLNGSSTFHGAM